MTTIIEKIAQLMTTTQEEDTQYLNEVIQEIKVKRKPGRQKNIHQKNYLNESERATEDVITQTLRKT